MYNVSTTANNLLELLLLFYKILVVFFHVFSGFPGFSVVKNAPPRARDMGLIPGPGGPHMPWSN